MNRSRFAVASSLALWLACGQNNQNEPPVCGNLVVELGEECDDGNTLDADGCEADCSLPRCQNGVLDPGETCLQESQLLLADRPIALQVADLNNDNNLDLIVANELSSEIGVFLGQGNGAFAKVTRFALSQTPTAFALADSNADGLLDLFVALQDDDANNNLVLLVNASIDANLVFDEQALPTVAKAPKDIVVADLNQDTLNEIIVLSTGESSISVLDLVGQPLQVISLEQTPSKLLVTDLNADALPELVVSFAAAARVSVFANNGGVLSTNSANLAVGVAPGAMTSADLDGDADQDVALVLSGESAVQILINTAGALSAQPPVGVGVTPSAIAALDLDADADQDLVSVNLSSNDATFLLNDLGVFANPQRVSLGLQPIALQSADLNNDQLLDLVALNRGSDELSLFLQQNGFAQETTRLPTLGAPTALLALDADTAVILHPASSDVTLLTNGVATRLATPITPDAAALADLDQDQQLDLIIASRTQNQVSFFLQATGVFSAPLPVGTSPVAVVVADFTGDGFLDIATANTLSDDLTLLTSNADVAALSFSAVNFLAQGVALPTALAVGDMDGDADSDLVVSNGVNGDVVVLLQNAGVFTASGKKRAGGSASAIGLADLSGDDKLDVVVTSLDNNDAQVIINAGFAAGQVQFKEPVAFAVGLAPSFVSFGDFDLDAQQDALVANQDSRDLALLRNNGLNAAGQAQFEAQFFILDRVPFGAIILDQNEDGFSDLLVGIQEDRALRLLLSAP